MTDPFQKSKDNILGIEKSAQEHKLSTKAIYVIWSDEHHQVLHDPMTSQPVNASNPAHLREAAKAFKGRIIPAAEAVKLLLNPKKR